MDNQPSANPKQQLVDRLKTANNILVTVSTNPSVDQLASCIGLTLVLNKLNKHATAVFSGEVPSTLEFLKPHDTLEKTTDSLRDFIISLDKSKADKLRYKVEDKVVKIFITPYRTSLSADDLEFSQGDFNVDVVVALGVEKQEDLDNAIMAHGRILHDATVASVNTTAAGGLGSINWHDAQASSLCELVVDLTKLLGENLLDAQVATALLTGVVAETDRFSNDKTSPQTMSVSAELMSNGADQQLVASKLEVPAVNTSAGKNTDDSKDSKSDAGTVEINHPQAKDDAETLKDETPDSGADSQQPASDAPEPAPQDIFAGAEAATDQPSSVNNENSAQKFVSDAPALGGTLTANTEPETYDPSSDPLSLPKLDDQPLLDHDDTSAAPALASQPLPAPITPATGPTSPPAFSWNPPSFVANSPEPTAPPSPVAAEHVTPAEPSAPENSESSAQTDHMDAAREEVEKALSSVPPAPEPVQALNAHPIDLQPPAGEPVPSASPVVPPAQPSTAFDPAAFGVINDPDVPAAPTPPPAPDFSSPMGQSLTMPLPPSAPPVAPVPQPTVNDPTAPPPVPPPLPFQFGNTPGQNQK